MFGKSSYKIDDKVQFCIGNDNLTGIITSISPSGRIARVRVIKRGRRCYHEWLKINQIKLVDKGD